MRKEVNSMAKDPVCGMPVVEKSVAMSAYKEKTYYFCSNSCKRDFDSNPAFYVAAAPERDSGGHK